MGATVVLCGGARGADQFGKEVAIDLGIMVRMFPAKWDHYGKSAGYRRNEEMAANADACVLFPGGKGTKHMHDLAVKYHLNIIKYHLDIINYDDDNDV